MRLNLHHALWVDGSLASSSGGADFHDVSAVADADVARLVGAIRTRSNRWDEKAPAALSAVPSGLPIYIEATEPGGDP